MQKSGMVVYYLQIHIAVSDYVYSFIIPRKDTTSLLKDGRQ